jgi:uridine phosphorylase
MLPASELLFTNDGRIYHLHLKPEQVADKIILVGDPGRVDIIAGFFDYKEFVESNREFVTVTGYYRGERITAMSTGIGVGNIDIVMNELDALVNINFNNREIKEEKKVLNIVRIGTSGALQENIPVGSYILSKKAIGLDGLLNFHAARNAICDLSYEKAFLSAIPGLKKVILPYVVDGSDEMIEKLNSEKTYKGVTITTPGFYGSQGRALRMELALPGLNDQLEQFEFKGENITNYEMETSALYAYAKLLGHEAATICLALTNRPRKEALDKYKRNMQELIAYTLDSIIELS